MTSETVFVGRTRELSELAAHRESSTQAVLSVVATAGMGKTRLVRQYLSQLEDDREGIFVSLVEITDEEDVLDTIVAACGVVPTGRNDLERVCRRLGTREAVGVVVVLDNAEQVTNAVSPVAQRLAELDFVQVVVTSREPLGLAREVVLRLPPLAHEEGVRLLQALAAQRGVVVADEEANELAEALDGLPLAIGLAAERTTILSPAQIQARLRDSNRVLRSSQGNRHASLNMALEHSWVHLSQEERALCANLAAFDFALFAETAEALWPEHDVRPLAERLVARSWLTHRHESGHERYQMLNAVRVFVREQTSEVERVDAHERLVQWALAQLDQPQSWWASRVREGHFAFNTLFDRGDVVDAARVISKLFLGAAYGYNARTIAAQGIDVVNLLTDRDDAPEHRALCSYLCSLISKLSVVFAFGHDAVDWAKRAVELANDLPSRARALSQLTLAYYDRRETALAKATAREGLRLIADKDLGEQTETEIYTWLLNFSTVLHGTGDVDDALAAIDRALKYGTNDPILPARALSHRAYVLFDLARFEACEAVLEQSRAWLKDAPESEHFLAFNALPAFLHIARGRLDEAQAYLDRLMEFAEANDHRSVLFYALRAAAALASARGLSPLRPLQRAYYQVACVDGSLSGISECRTLFALDEVAEGHYDEAERRLALLTEEPGERLAGERTLMLQMLRASIRFAETMRTGTPSKRADSSNPFEAVVDIALGSIAAGSLRNFDEACAKFDLASLIIPGFFMFRFESQARSWVHAHIYRRKLARLCIERSGRMFSVDGQVHDFSRKQALRRLLKCLAEAATQNPGQPVSAHDLVRYTWPSDAEVDRASLNRAYTTVNRLRATTDLGPHVQSSPRGYCLRPSLQIEWVDKLDAVS